MSGLTFLEDLHEARKSLMRRPLRFCLSSIGVGIGATALIAMLALGEGAEKAALDRIRSLGIATLRVESSVPSTGAETAAPLTATISEFDLDLIFQWLGTRGIVGAYRKRDGVMVSGKNGSSRATTLGIDRDWFGAEKLHPGVGRLLDSADSRIGSGDCVIGKGLAANLGVGLGEILRVSDLGLSVVGILEPRGKLLTEGTGLSAMDFDHILIMPAMVMMDSRLGSGREGYDGLVVRLRTNEPGEIVRTGQQLGALLLSNHDMREDFTIVVPMALLAKERESRRIFSLITGTIAGLSLLVGGIGVMNVMLANIAEQTREIGLRMVVGATRARIITLYLFHSLLITGAGAVGGIAGGGVLALLVEKYTGWPVEVSIFSLVLATSATLLTGFVFGLQPALRASAMQPSSALKET